MAKRIMQLAEDATIDALRSGATKVGGVEVVSLALAEQVVRLIYTSVDEGIEFAIARLRDDQKRKR